MVSSRSYVLFDIPAGDRPVDADFLARLGHPVQVCNGPGDGACPLVEGKGCPLARNAHGIVFELDLDNPKHQEVLSTYREKLRDDVPLRVVVRPGQEAEFAPLLKGIKVWTHEPVAGDLDAMAAEIEAADALR